jgi:hypothetical protein
VNVSFEVGFVKLSTSTFLEVSLFSSNDKLAASSLYCFSLSLSTFSNSKSSSLIDSFFEVSAFWNCSLFNSNSCEFKVSSSCLICGSGTISSFSSNS